MVHGLANCLYGRFVRQRSKHSALLQMIIAGVRMQTRMEPLSHHFPQHLVQHVVGFVSQDFVVIRSFEAR